MSSEFATSPRRVRLLELLLVILSTFGTTILLSLYVLFGRVNVDKAGLVLFNVRLLEGFFETASALALLGYVLWRQGRTFSSLGFAFYWKDVPRSIVLCLLAMTASWVWAWTAAWGAYFLTGHGSYSRPHNIGFLHSRYGSPRFFLLLLYACVNPFHEELPVRAFLMTEVRALSGRWRWAILVSVAVQVSYHFYQGVGAALGYIPIFLMFSIYYARAGRIWPVILAHLYFDMGALIVESLRPCI